MIARFLGGLGGWTLRAMNLGPPPAVGFLLQEDGFLLLQEDGGRIQL